MSVPTKDHRVVPWPPEIANITPLGYMRDLSGNSYARDIGRSSEFSDGSVFIQFGDTFSHDIDGNFKGLSNNTCAAVTNRNNPTLLSYGPTQNRAGLGYDDQILNFIEPFKIKADAKDEHDTPQALKVDGDESNKQQKFWSFSGIVENERNGEYISGWTWFEKRKITPQDSEGYMYTGIAKVRYRPTAQTISATPKFDHCNGRPIHLFEKDEPHIGSFCAVRDGEYIFVYGQLPYSKDVVVGRVLRHLADDRRLYRFWTSQAANTIRNIGRENCLGGVWSDRIEDCIPVLQNMQHGQIFKTDMYPSSLKSPWAFVGCNATGDSQIVIGRSRAPEGAFTIVKLMTATPLMDIPTGSFTYCMYAHPWAFDIKKGDLMLSWSEGTMNGNVVAVIARLRTVEDDEEGAVEATKINHRVNVKIGKRSIHH